MSLPPLPRRAKIVCTLGPSTRSPGAIAELIDAGMDVARLNFSHGTHEEHRAHFERVRDAAQAAGRAVAVLGDLQGPKLRLGAFRGGGADLRAGDELVLTPEPITGDARRAPTPYPGLADEVAAGEPILLDDGRVRLEVTAIEGRDVRCRVIEGGHVGDHKGINLPGSAVRAPALTAKDAADLRFVLGLGIDLVALSFVRAAGDAEAARAIMAESGVRRPLLAKLEKPQAVEHLEAIVEAFDGLMVARGDLGVEMPLEQVPLVQKRAVAAARARARPVIVATQMLESMITASRPTRAEVSDVANAVLDGADAVMLSGETSIGAHPAEVVRTMARIVAAAEAAPIAAEQVDPGAGGVPAAIAHAAVETAREMDAKALVAFTQSGATARWLARHRRPLPLLAFTPDPVVRRQLALTWGMETFVMPRPANTDQAVIQVDRALLELSRFRRGERVVIVAGSPPGEPGTTNLLRVHRLGEA